MNEQAAAALERALELSHAVLAAAGRGEGEAVSFIDAERRQLLQFVRKSVVVFDAGQRRMIHEIAALNGKSIDAMERQRDAKTRQMQEAAMGRRAVRAYGHVRRLR